jgi:hypothetical protein
MKIVSIFFLLVFVTILSATETVFWSKENISVGEEVLLTIETDSIVSDIISPEIGLFAQSNELPFVEIMSTTKDNTRILIQMRFTKSGKHELIIKWKNEENIALEKQVTIEIKSLLKENENEALDIEEPLEFSGPYFFRLFVIVLIFTMIVGVLYYLFLRVGKRQKVFKDALYNESVGAEKMEPIDTTLNKLLLNPEILHKDFVYSLSEYLKLALSEKLDIDVTFMTQSEIEEILNSKLFLTDKQISEFTMYLNSIKYMPNNEKLTNTNAISIRNYWEKILGI